MGLRFFLGIWLTSVFTMALSLPMVSQPVSWYQFPIIPGLEDKARILFFHVPCAWLSVLCFLASMIFGIRYLRTKSPIDDIRSASAAGLGLLFCILATATGAIWAKFSWGTFWNWDPRQTSIFILLLIYGAYFGLRTSIDIEERRATLSAVYAIIAAVIMPFFMFVMPRILASLHPEPLLNTRGEVHMNGTMLTVFLSSVAGFTAFCFWLWTIKVRLHRLELSTVNQEAGINV